MEVGPDQLVASFMRSQHGLVTRAQALGAGLTARHLHQKLQHGEWLPLQPGVYHPAGVAPARTQLILAACLAGGTGTVASHRSAAWLWDLIAPGAMVVEVTVPHERRRRLNGVVVHRSRHPDDAVWRNGLPVTSPVATLIDLAEVVGAEMLGRALDQAHRRKVATGNDVLAALSERSTRGCPGVELLRRVLAHRGYPGIAASVLERRTLAVLRAAGLPPPMRELGAGGAMPYRVDFAWPPTQVLVEVDGFDTHGTPAALQADLARQNELVSAGWVPLRYTWSDITRAPDRVVRQVARVLAQARGLSNWGN